MLRSLLPALLALPLLLTACRKEPGEGGRAEIRGFVYEQRYGASSGNPQGDPYPLAEARVYIIYGDGQYADDDTRTGPNGEFRFAWLRQGDYRIYVISECNAYINCTEGIYLNTEVTSRKDVVNVGRITVRNY